MPTLHEGLSYGAITHYYLELQSKILHCLANGTQLAWLIDIQRQQIWVWQGAELPIICAGIDPLPTLGTLEGFMVDAVIALSQQR